MSWDDQVSAEESRGLVSGVICASQAPLSTSLMSHGPNHGMTESSSLVDSLPQVSQQVTSDIVTPDVIYDCDL